MAKMIFLSAVFSCFLAYTAIYSLKAGMLKGNSEHVSFRYLVAPFIIVYAVMMETTLVSKNMALAIVNVYAMEIVLAILYFRTKYRHFSVFLAMFFIWLGNMVATYALAGAVGRNDLMRALLQLPLLMAFFVIFITKNFSIGFLIRRRGN